jgi:hypothetical protein
MYLIEQNTIKMPCDLLSLEFEGDFVSNRFKNAKINTKMLSARNIIRQDFGRETEVTEQVTQTSAPSVVCFPLLYYSAMLPLTTLNCDAGFMFKREKVMAMTCCYSFSIFCARTSRRRNCTRRLTGNAVCFL